MVIYLTHFTSTAKSYAWSISLIVLILPFLVLLRDEETREKAITQLIGVIGLLFICQNGLEQTENVIDELKDSKGLPTNSGVTKPVLNQWWASNLHAHSSNQSKTPSTTTKCKLSEVELNPSQVDFFLPKVDAGCACQMCETTLLHKEPSLGGILRPWQAVFLIKHGIFTTSDLVAMSPKQAKSLSKAMVLWRKDNGLESHKRKGCYLALHIWSRVAAQILCEFQQRNRCLPPLLRKITLSHDGASLTSYSSSDE